MAKVSVLIPAYNAEEYLEKCLDSVINQSFQDIEVIIVDDGSTDGTWKICQKYAEIDQRVKVFHQKNEGCISARRKLLLMSTGDYVFFIDADDWIGRDRIENLYKLGVENNVDMVIGSFSSYNAGAVSDNTQYFDIGYYNRQRIEKEIFPFMLAAKPHFTFGIKPSLWQGGCRRSLLVDSYKNVPEDITLGEDACIMYACILMANSVYISDDLQYYYRLNEQSMTHIWNPNILVQAGNLFKYLEKLFSKTQWDFILPQLEEYKAYISWVVIRKALTSSNVNLNRLSIDIENYLIQNDIMFSLRNIRRKKMTFKRRFIYLLMERKKWSVLKKMLN